MKEAERLSLGYRLRKAGPGAVSYLDRRPVIHGK